MKILRDKISKAIINSFQDDSFVKDYDTDLHELVEVDFSNIDLKYAIFDKDDKLIKMTKEEIVAVNKKISDNFNNNNLIFKETFDIAKQNLIDKGVIEDG